MTEQEGNRHEIPPKETENIPINTWFQLFPGELEKEKSLKHHIILKLDPLDTDVRWDSPLITEGLPISILATFLDGLRARNGYRFHEFPFRDILQGYTVTEADFDPETREKKIAALENSPPPKDAQYTFYWLEARIHDSIPEVLPFFFPNSREVRPEIQEYIRGVRFRIGAPQIGALGMRESLPESVDKQPYWNNFYNFQTGPLSEEDGVIKTSGTRVASTRAHIQDWYGAFLAPGVKSLDFPKTAPKIT